MCIFFSFVGDGFGNYKYLDWDFRKDNLNENNDSHTFILTHFKVPPKMQDKWSKYEYNPITKELTVDEGVEGHDHESVEAWVNGLNFKTIIPQLIVKDIVNPLIGEPKEITEEDIELLKKWNSVWNSVRDSVWDSVWSSVRDSVRDSVSDLVWNSVRDSVRDLVWGSVWSSVWNSVKDSVSDSVWAYTGSFFGINYKYDLSSINELWNKGLVPSFDGKTWRLHSGKNAKIIYTWNKED